MRGEGCPVRLATTLCAVLSHWAAYGILAAHVSPGALARQAPARCSPVQSSAAAQCSVPSPGVSLVSFTLSGPVCSGTSPSSVSVSASTTSLPSLVIIINFKQILGRHSSVLSHRIRLTTASLTIPGRSVTTVPTVPSCSCPALFLRASGQDHIAPDHPARLFAACDAWPCQTTPLRQARLVSRLVLSIVCTPLCSLRPFDLERLAHDAAIIFRIRCTLAQSV